MTEDQQVILDEKFLKLVESGGSAGVLQSKAWNELGVDSRGGARLAIKFERRSLIRRKRALSQGRWTWKLIRVFPS